SERGRGSRVEVVHPVVALGARCIEIVAYTEVQGQLPGDTPIILQVQRRVKALRSSVFEALDQRSAAAGPEQQAGDRIAAVAGGCVGIRPLREARGKTEVAGSRSRFAVIHP